MTQPAPMTLRPPHPPLPLLRAAVFAVVGTVLGVSAHRLVAEEPMPWRESAVAVVLLFGVGLIGVRRPRSLATMVATSATAQVGLHLWLSAEHMGPTAAMAMPADMHHGMHAPGTWHDQLHDSSAMTAVHALVAVLVAILLHRADAACWSLARGVTAAVERLRAWLTTVRALLNGRPVPAEFGPSAAELALEWTGLPRLKGTLLAGVVVRRGPPTAGLILAN